MDTQRDRSRFELTCLQLSSGCSDSLKASDGISEMTKQGSVPWWLTPVGSAVNLVLRCAFLPVFLVIELLELPRRLCWQEPAEYNPRCLLLPGRP